ncbi:hypothetical protein [Paenibacillus brevis]|uniref:Spore coat protein n=1 Tax=Paenibacillus brevis TaxID=2841508 RepID=A0ABS6FTZ8_9BACL|nr:hypothetical protein [Paenibacillus brevis]
MKWLLKFARLGLVVVMVTLLTVLTTGYVVNTYIQTLLGSYNLSIAGQAPSLGSMMKGMLGFGSQGGSDSKGQPAPDRNEQAGAGLDAAGASGTERLGENNTSEDQEANGDTGSSPVEGDVEEEAPEGSIPVMGGIAGEAAGAGQDQQVLVTPDDLLAKKDELSDSEKEEVFATLMSKLPQEEMLRMSELIEGGLTETEMIEIEQILSKHLSKEEYAKILNLLKK